MELEKWRTGHAARSQVILRRSGRWIRRRAASPHVGGERERSPVVPLPDTTSIRWSDKDDEPEPAIDVFRNEGTTSNKRVVFDRTKRRIAFGGGCIDRPAEGFGLSIEDGFARGTTARCVAFRNEPLLRGKDGVFDILDMEVWGFAFGQF